MSDSQSILGKYHLLDRIAMGGMAEIFRAKAKGAEGFEKLVAVKRILPQMVDDQEFVDMFIDEAKTVAQLSHANICQIFEFGQEAGTYFIALELVEGRDLKQVMLTRRRQGQPIPLPIVLAIISKTCEALEYAHNCKTPEGEPMNIVHRDVSPQNVLISYLGSVKLIDFGIAKAMGRLTKTSAGNIKGKFAYMSPEQVSAHPIDHRSDIFACGTVLWEALTNKRLFKAENEIVTMQMVRKAEITPPSEVNPDLPKGIDPIVLKSLARDPEERYQNTGDLLDDLERFAAGSDNVCTSRQLASWMQEVFAEEYKKSRSRKDSNEEVLLLGQANRKEDSVSNVQAQVPTSEAGAGIAREVSQQRSMVDPNLPWHEQSHSGISSPSITGPGTGSYSGSYPGAELSASYSVARRRRKSSKTPLYFGIVLAAVLIGSATAFFLTRPPKETKKPTPDKAKVVAVTRASTPKATTPKAEPPPGPGAEVKPAGEGHTAAAKTEPPARTEPKTEPPAKTEPKTEPPAKVAAPVSTKGKLIISTKPWAKVWIDGTETGRNTPIPATKPIILSPGKHWVTLLAKGKKFSYAVTIRVGKVTSLIKNLPVD